jgi:hypothetical protein
MDFILDSEERPSLSRAVRRIAALLGLLAIGTAHATCGSAFCVVNSNWNVQGAWTEPGARLDLRYESIDQDQTRNGSRKIAFGEIARDHDEISTRNRNWLANLDYTFSAEWGATLSVPYVDRRHEHILNDDTNGPTPQSWDFRRLGDARILLRRQNVKSGSPDEPLDAYGLNFGAKLPTGSFKLRNSEGDLAERTLQPGTGTTDALLGGYFHRALPMKNLSWFAQSLLQKPLNARAEFRPGARLSFDTGLRYEISEAAALMLQANLLLRGRDRGSESEPEDSGGKAIFLSPGASYTVSRDVQMYGFLQLPVYQYVNGVQITAKTAAVIGVSTRF